MARKKILYTGSTSTVSSTRREKKTQDDYLLLCIQKTKMILITSHFVTETKKNIMLIASALSLRFSRRVSSIAKFINARLPIKPLVGNKLVGKVLILPSIRRSSKRNRKSQVAKLIFSSLTPNFSPLLRFHLFLFYPTSQEIFRAQFL